ncbi:hypothetical protein INT48_008263 [Thamnidium elegans]|uniref:Cation/H+ exchanger transmembrane domain-containing protein n=1 Tax=Thamnidium elegans TaxID=101142 RepID=A0A8H7SI20_9FUNG|nr:hypothetical protein INT48_008263 [Thamnidium elegans]
MSMTGFSGSDDLLACFVAGNAFSWDDWFRQETEEAHFQDVIDMMLNLAVFVYIGAIIPWEDFGNTELGLTPWRLVVIAILILIFRRLPILILLKPVMPALKTYREAIFSGWFGPMGVGAVFLAMVAKEEMEEIYHGSENPPVTIRLIKPVVLFIVLSSTLVHGTTIPLFKIGNRIRTRTLSIASTGSGQVLRLPKLQFGQQINMRRNEEERAQQDQNAEAMLQLKRNTLLNTIQQSSQQQNTPDNYAINMNDDDDFDGLNEEDFLPDESDETEIGHDDSGKLSPLKQHHLPTAATTESQSIRFLEPVNPRSGSAAQMNLDKNEASVSSFRSWMHRNKENPTEDIGIVTSSPSPHAGGGGGGGLRNLFRRNHKDNGEDVPHQEGMPTVEVTPAHENNTIDTLKNIFPIHHEENHDQIIDLGNDHMSSRIEVWDEPNHVIIEDKRDASSHSVIDKSNANWKLLVKEKIKELQTNIDNEVDVKSS